jgi:hypothetical protein
MLCTCHNVVPVEVLQLPLSLILWLPNDLQLCSSIQHNIIHRYTDTSLHARLFQVHLPRNEVPSHCDCLLT